MRSRRRTHERSRTLADFGDRNWSPRLVRFLPWILVWLLVVLVVAALVVRQDQLVSFARDARTATGIVTAREPENHAIVRAVYEIDGARYEIADSMIGPPNPDFDTLRPGDKVMVYYDPAAPSRAVLFEPQARRASAIGFAILAALVLPALVLGALIGALRLWKIYRSTGHP